MKRKLLLTAFFIMCTVLMWGCSAKNPVSSQASGELFISGAADDDNKGGTTGKNNNGITDWEDRKDKYDNDSDYMKDEKNGTEADTQMGEKDEMQESKDDKLQESVNTDIPEVEDDGSLKVPSNSGRLHVEGTLIKNESGQTVQLKGLSTHGIAWYPDYINNDLFREFRNEWNCNVIRLAMYTEEYGGYVNGDKTYLKKLIDNGVKYATDNDMYVIIDWHILSDDDPNKNKGEAKKFFKEISALYSDHNNVIYEICNEPNGNTKWKDIKKYAEEIIPVIRENDENAIIIVGTPNWSQQVDKAAKDPITGYDNIMYTLHFYADTHKDDLRKTLKKAVESGLPVFVTEYGICDASGNGAINTSEANKWMELLDEYSISSCAWNVSNKSETSAVFKASVSKKSNFTDKDLSDSGKWVYAMLTGKSEYVPDPDRVISSDSSSNNKGAGDGNNNGGNEQAEIPKDAREIQVGNFIAYLTESNSWSSGEGNFHQYTLTLVNNGSDVSSWTVSLTFDSNISFQQGWGGIYSADGKNLTITNESYNGYISKDGSVRDIGFIIVY